MKVRRKIGDLGKAQIQQLVQDFLDELDEGAVALLEHFEESDNPEFIEVEVDEEQKILGFTRKDGSHYAYNLSSETIDALAERIYALEHAPSNESFENIEDIEDRLQIGKDSEDKVYNYRKADGTLVENVGVETTKVSTNSLELTEQGMNDFQQALKDTGFQPGGGGDWSDREVIELPEPKHYSLLNIKVDNLPINDSDVSEGYVEYYDGLGNYFKMTCELAAQGQTSRIFARTGGKGNYTLDLPKDIKFGKWVPQDSFHLKGCAKDVTRGYLVTSYKWAYKMLEYLDAKPNRVLLKDNKITTLSASGDNFTDWGDGARCLPDGFPVEVYLNGEYWGLYALQLKKHRKNYSMKKSDYTSFILDPDNFMNTSTGDGFWRNNIWWAKIEIRNPKDLVCMDGTAYDGDSPKELIDSTSEFWNPDNTKHVGSANTKQIIQSWPGKYQDVKDLINNSDIEGAKDLFNQYFDYNACMLVYIFNCLNNNADSIGKNTLWATYKNGKISPMLWDLDGMYGEGWIGNAASGPNAGLWEGIYANAEWPLSLFWMLYETEIKAMYSELRDNKIISVETWHNVVFNKWVNRIGEEAYKRDIEKWDETPSYRKNYTNTDYWEELGFGYYDSSIPEWDENTNYSTNEIVCIKESHSDQYMRYKAKANSIGVCPVTKFYNMFPSLGGYYNSPKRMQKWITRQIELCDSVMGYNS